MPPLIHFASPPAKLPADTCPPPGTVSRDTFSQACARSLNSPVIVTDIGDGALLVEPLHFHRVLRRGVEGQVVVAKYHDTANTGVAQRDLV